MPNKKRIRKLLQAKYKPSRKVVYFDHHKFGYEFGKAAGNAARQLSLICKALTEIMAGVRLNRRKYEQQKTNPETYPD